MIEDALKATRTLHRLIMAVSLTTLVFALSLSLPKEKVAQRDAIDALINSDFLAYDQIVAKQVKTFREENLVPFGTTLNKKVNSTPGLTSDLYGLGEVYSKQLHIGKLLTKNLVLANISSATLSQLNSLDTFQIISRDVQVVVPRIKELTEKVEAFLSDNSVFGYKLGNIRVNGKEHNSTTDFVEEQKFTTDSFLPGADTNFLLEFDLVNMAGNGLDRTFSEHLTADYVTLPKSSFVQWLANNEDMVGVVSIDDSQVVFAPSLENAPKGIREEKLGSLLQRLTNEIESERLEGQSVTILGTQVPGLLIIVAAPLTLLALSYYFTNHTGHLAQLIEKDAKAFKGFAWMPLAIRIDFPLFFFRKAEGDYRISGWVLETITSSVILPVASLAILYWQLTHIVVIGLWPSLVILIASIGIVIFGLKSLRNIKTVRTVEESS